MREAGILTPKPLIPIAGMPLIDRVLGAVVAAGITDVACIFNEEADEVEAHCRRTRIARSLHLEIVRRTTASSLASLLALAPYVQEDRFLAVTVDSVFGPRALPEFLSAAAVCTDAEGVLAVTDYVDDENPLHVLLEPDGRIRAIGPKAAASSLVTAGLYVFHPQVFAAIDPASRATLTALRHWLATLLDRRCRFYGVPVAKTIDVDRPHDIAIAEAFVRNGFV